jgi:hypothetical protein
MALPLGIYLSVFVGLYQCIELNKVVWLVVGGEGGWHLLRT